jgi:hypothetical protein
MLTPTDFKDLPDLLADYFRDLPSGATVRLVTVEHTPAEDWRPISFVIDVEYHHEHFEYRNPGNKDAVAYGRASAEGGRGQPVRILFSQFNRTATIRGLALGGRAKLAPDI